MADWTAPFHRPHMTTEEYKKAKQEYVEKYGYTITVPGLSDIFHVWPETPLTEQETRDWKNRNYDKFSPERYEEIKAMKQKRKEKYLSMLGSPTPGIMRTAGSILTSLDDAQDALTTIHVIGRIAMHFAPRILGPILGGPVGWIMLAADTINLIQHLGRTVTMPMMAKRTKDYATAENPYSKKSKLKRATKLTRLWPSKGEVIEILQTTDQIYGVGICLGPVVGFAQDIFFGSLKMLTGEKVRLNPGLPNFPFWTQAAQRASKATTFYLGAGYMHDDMEMMEVFMANYLAQQELLVAQADWNPLDHIIDITQTAVRAPIPRNILTQEVIEEEGKPLKEVIGWPHNLKEWAATNDIVNEYDAPARNRLDYIMKKHEHDWLGYAFGGLATGATFHALANLEGEEVMTYDYSAQSKMASILLGNGLMPPEDMTEWEKGQIAWKLKYWEHEGIKPTIRNLTELFESLGTPLVPFA